MDEKSLINSIKKTLNDNKTKEEIYLNLINNGVKVDDINEAFYRISFNKIGNSEKEEKEKHLETHNKTLRLMVVIGAILIGLGIFSFIASNWQEMSKTVKVLIIIISMLLSYGAGWFVKEKLNYSRTGNALFFLGSIIYGAGLFLIAQIFNIRANWPDGFILWMIGAIIMAYVLELNIYYYFSILLGIIAIAGHQFGVLNVFLPFDSFLLTSTVLLIIAAVLTFLVGKGIKNKIPVELKNF